MAKLVNTISSIPATSVKKCQPTFGLKVLQEPLRARACGYSSKFTGRRIVDPPPVIKLSLTNDGEDIINNSLSAFILTCDLIKEDCSEDDNRKFEDEYLEHNHLIRHDSLSNLKKKQQQEQQMGQQGLNNLFGSTTVSATITNNNSTNDSLNAFFVFTDISIRFEGTYRFNFTLYEYSLLGKTKLIKRESILSDSFQCFSAKQFPGLASSPLLIRQVSELGCRVRVRNVSGTDGKVKKSRSGSKRTSYSDDRKSTPSGEVIDDQEPTTKRQIPQVLSLSNISTISHLHQAPSFKLDSFSTSRNTSVTTSNSEVAFSTSYTPASPASGVDISPLASSYRFNGYHDIDSMNMAVANIAPTSFTQSSFAPAYNGGQESEYFGNYGDQTMAFISDYDLNHSGNNMNGMVHNQAVFNQAASYSFGNNTYHDSVSPTTAYFPTDDGTTMQMMQQRYHSQIVPQNQQAIYNNAMVMLPNMMSVKQNLLQQQLMLNGNYNNWAQTGMADSSMAFEYSGMNSAVANGLLPNGKTYQMMN